jgi:L-fucose isomerase-like protein
MLIAKGKAVESKQQLRGSWCWVEVPDLGKLYTTLVTEGFTHHASLIHGDCSKAVKDACMYLGIETIEV